MLEHYFDGHTWVNVTEISEDEYTHRVYGGAQMDSYMYRGYLIQIDDDGMVYYDSGLYDTLEETYGCIQAEREIDQLIKEYQSICKTYATFIGGFFMPSILSCL